MIRRFVLLFLMVPAILFAGPEGHGFNDDEIRWWNFEDGSAEAVRQNKRIFMLVHTDWCPACLAYRKQFFDPQVVALSKNFVFVIVDADAESEISLRYAPDGNYFPRSMILTPNARLIERIKTEYAEDKWYLDPDTPDDLLWMLTVGTPWPPVQNAPTQTAD
ncbi:thioredoxin family protein [Halovulum sp. GXIMD14793]